MTTVTITLDNGLGHTFKSPDAAIWSNDGRSFMRVRNLHMGMCTWLEDRDDPDSWGFVVEIRHGLPPMVACPRLGVVFELVRRRG